MDEADLPQTSTGQMTTECAIADPQEPSSNSEEACEDETKLPPSTVQSKIDIFEFRSDDLPPLHSPKLHTPNPFEMDDVHEPRKSSGDITGINDSECSSNDKKDDSDNNDSQDISVKEKMAPVSKEVELELPEQKDIQHQLDNSLVKEEVLSSSPTEPSKDHHLNQEINDLKSNNFHKSPLEKETKSKADKLDIATPTPAITIDTSRELVDFHQRKVVPSAFITSLQHCESFPDLSNIDNGGKDNNSKSFLDKRNLIYRLSLRFSPYRVLLHEIPNAENHSHYDKAGYLQKLSGRGFPYLNQWKRRYCVLTKGHLYLYEKESSKGTDKATNVVDLKYFDQVTEAIQKESKKASNVFVVTSQDRSFFDPGRHLFAADTLTDMHDWILKLRESIELIRNNNRPSAAIFPKERPKSDVPLEGAIEGDLDQHLDLLSTQPLRSEDEVDSKAAPRGQQEDEFQPPKEKPSRPQVYELKSEKNLQTSDQNGGTVPATTTTMVQSSERKFSSTQITLQAPSLSIDAKPYLESITKHRARGPSGRRAPQSRKTVLMKQRASSLSALQQEGQPQFQEQQEDDPQRENEDEGDCQHLLENESHINGQVPLNSSQPILAYHYSSDEDSISEDGRGSNRSLKNLSCSQSQLNEAKEISFNIKKIPTQPVKGLRVYLQRKEDPGSHSQTDEENLLEYRSLPRSLQKASLKETLINKNYSTEQDLGSGRASPEMDALENLLMNRSLIAGTSASHRNLDAASDQEGSDPSTYKAKEDRFECPSKAKNSESVNEDLSKALENFSSALKHLQHHTTDLECRTERLESEFTIHKSDVTNLQQTTEEIRRDVKKLSETVAIINTEVSRTKKEHVSQRQEIDKLQKDAFDSLSRAKQSQREFENAKANYETTIKDLHSLIASIRSSFIVSTDTGPELKQTHSLEKKIHRNKVSLSEVGKSYSESDKHKKPMVTPIQETKDLSTAQKRSSGSDSKKEPAKELSNQKGGYQSFFQRPSSLIYSLASRSSNKSLASKTDKDSETSINKNEAETKKKLTKQTEAAEKKRKGDKQIQSQSEKKSKSKNNELSEDTKEEVRRQSKQKSFNVDKSQRHSTSSKEKKAMPPSFSTENIPMMDDHTDSFEMKSSSGKSYSQSHNFHLEKSLSSPTVVTKFSGQKAARPNVLNLSPMSSSGMRSTSDSNASSPDSPVSPSGFPFPSSKGRVNADENKYCSEIEFLQSSNMGYPRPNTNEERSVMRTRQGTFGISRQRSSPNIPLQRQSSGPIYPLQRQHSLGTVPEEGQLPRQASLMSVPEERPIVDQTLPLSPASSVTSFALSLYPSTDRLDSSARNSMELVAGPVVSGSLYQEAYIRPLPPASEFDAGERPYATSSLKKSNERKSTASKEVSNY